VSIDLRRHAAGDLGTIEGALLSVYGEVHAADGIFHSTDRFAERLASHAKAPGWTAIIAYDDDQPTAFTYAAPLMTSRWWSAMLTPLPLEYTAETGTRTLALFELMVRLPWRGTGLAARLHETLLAGRAEERVTLLVDPANVKVKARYESWGYHNVGPQQPFPDSPRYATMVKTLNGAHAGAARP